MIVEKNLVGSYLSASGSPKSAGGVCRKRIRCDLSVSPEGTGNRPGWNRKAKRLRIERFGEDSRTLILGALPLVLSLGGQGKNGNDGDISGNEQRTCAPGGCFLESVDKPHERARNRFSEKFSDFNRTPVI